jgi:integrase/recombinase XerD
MSTLEAAAADYLRVRRALGYKLGRQGRQLLQFVAYLEQVGASTVTIEHAIAWVTQPAGADCNYWCDRLSVVRQFARYLRRSTRRARCHRSGFCPTGADDHPRTCTRRRRSQHC